MCYPVQSELLGRDGPKPSNPVTTAATGTPAGGGMMQSGRGNMSGVGGHPKLPPNALHLSGAGATG